mmetsp:Transcript_33361/g.109322  ORF Transcript_33361/g.109322 Transcript_33361/m.109322 type:complete len:433 (-) Transcript_33361:953-2251(-)
MSVSRTVQAEPSRPSPSMPAARAGGEASPSKENRTPSETNTSVGTSMFRPTPRPPCKPRSCMSMTMFTSDASDSAGERFRSRMSLQVNFHVTLVLPPAVPWAWCEITYCLSSALPLMLILANPQSGRRDMTRQMRAMQQHKQSIPSTKIMMFNALAASGSGISDNCSGMVVDVVVVDTLVVELVVVVDVTLLDEVVAVHVDVDDVVAVDEVAVAVVAVLVVAVLVVPVYEVVVVPVVVVLPLTNTVPLELTRTSEIPVMPAPGTAAAAAAAKLDPTAEAMPAADRPSACTPKIKEKEPAPRRLPQLRQGGVASRRRRVRRVTVSSETLPPARPSTDATKADSKELFHDPVASAAKSSAFVTPIVSETSKRSTCFQVPVVVMVVVVALGTTSTVGSEVATWKIRNSSPVLLFTATAIRLSPMFAVRRGPAAKK